ncbi:hypothetical protein VNO77_36146 [Canavalia gladiata]|uniref:BURP domain-containing protein n=1 Tax=Canavalia gladiata TaxID=3824 RepID=A0AAN9K6V7_CANGL
MVEPISKKPIRVIPSHDNKPYISQYGKIDSKKHTEESSHDNEPNTARNCGTGPKKHPKNKNGDDKIEAFGICHLNTSDWSQDHILFSQLGFKPGQAPVCHFFPVKHLMWVPQPSEATM